MILYPRDRVVVANLLGPSKVDRSLRIVIVVLGDSGLYRLTILQDASEDTFGQFAQSGCAFLSQLHQRHIVLIVLSDSSMVFCG